MKKILWMMVFTSMLAGCGNTQVSWTPITFSTFTMEIDALFQSFPLEKLQVKKNSQTLLAAYTIPSSDTKIFDTNFIISSKKIPATLSSYEYMTINASKLQEKLQKYALLSQQKLEFPCGKNTIYGYLHTFTTDQSVGTTQRLFTISHYYFTIKDQGYTLSFTTTNSTDLDLFKESLATLKCS